MKRILKQTIFCVIFLSGFLMWANVKAADLSIPDSRKADWSYAGVPGGIPAREINCTTAACNTLYGGDVTATTISAALDSAGTGVDNLFDEIIELAKDCKFVDCTHMHEPGCKVLAAVEAGQLDQSRYANYISLKKETEHFEMTEFEKKEKNRQFGKFIKKAKKGLREVGHKDF